MFKKTRRKIVLLIMGVMILILSETLFLIYFSSYRQVNQRYKNMLSLYVSAYWENGNPEGVRVEKPNPDMLESKTGDSINNLSTFYSVEFNKENKAVNVDNEGDSGLTDKYFIQLCQPLVDGKAGYGKVGNWMYYMEKKDSRTLIALMNNYVMNETVQTLFQNTFLFGGISILLFLLPAVWLSRLLVGPLELSSRKQKQFIADASHELKTPIAVVSANLELLERETGKNKWLDNIRVENQQMGELVQQLLELARTESTSAQMVNLDFSRLVTGAYLPFESVAFEKELELSAEITKDIWVRGNPEQLHQITAILLDNALEYSSKNKVVFISLKAERNKAVLSVQNEGREISKEEQNLLFERFYRRETERDRQHYGLGLTIAKAITTAHGGNLHVTCEGNNVAFIVTLSLCSPNI